VVAALRTVPDEVVSKRHWGAIEVLRTGAIPLIACQVLVSCDLQPHQPQEAASRGLRAEVGSALVAATPTKMISPVLPKAAVEQRRFGPVLVEITVAADGTVQSPHILRGDVLLNDLALEAVRQWRYEPFIFAGEPRATVITVAVPFKKYARSKASVLWQ
jgi:TonB family protein